MKYKGWYHNATTAYSGTIFFYEQDYSSSILTNCYGPFKTFAAAKKDAIEYHKADIRLAKEAIAELKVMKKPDKQEIL